MELNKEQAQTIARELSVFIDGNAALKGNYFVKIFVPQHPENSTSVLLYKKDQSEKGATNLSLADAGLPGELTQAIEQQFSKAGAGRPTAETIEIRPISATLFNLTQPTGIHR